MKRILLTILLFSLPFTSIVASHDEARNEFNLGLKYHQGIGVLQNDDKAISHYKKAANLGEPVKKGVGAFSLIELLVVIAIISILAAIAYPSYKTYVIKQRIAAVTPFLEKIAVRMKIYYAANGVWPTWSQLGYAGQDGYGGIMPNSIVPTVSSYLVQYTGQMSGLTIGSVPTTNCNPGPGMVSAIFDGRKLDPSSTLFNAQYVSNFGDHDVLMYSLVLYPTHNGTVISTYCGAYSATIGEEKYLPPNCQNTFINYPVTCS